jgi:hypothetical protein
VSSEEHLVIFKITSRRKKSTVRISWRGFMKNPPAIRSIRVTRRLQPHQEVKLGRIVSCRIVVGFLVSHSIRKKLY